MRMNRLRTAGLVFGVIACLLVAGASAAEGKRGKRGKKADGAGRAGPAAKATITIDGTDYTIVLVPVQGGKAKKGKPAGKQAVVTVAGKKYRVRIVDPNQPGGKKARGDKPKGGKGKAGKGKAGKGGKGGKDRKDKGKAGKRK